VVAVELLRGGGVPKLNADVDVDVEGAVSPVAVAFWAVPNPKPRGLPILPLG
jgi:hypothetical protein